MSLSTRPTHLQKPTHRPKFSSSEVQKKFREKREELTVIPHCSECAGCGRPYIQVEKLRNWLKEKWSKNTDISWADLCLEASNQGNYAGSLTLSDINAPGRECLLVFSILCEIGAPGLIREFQRQGLTDTKLPITLLELETDLSQLSIDNASFLAEKFDERQWAFCPAKFDWSSPFACKKPTVLPICKRGILSNKGGTALLWQIAVQEEFVAPNLRRISARSQFDDPDFGICYQFVLKTFRDGHAEFFKEECDAFWALREHDGMIRYLGDFSHPNDPSCQLKQVDSSNGFDQGESSIGDENRAGRLNSPGDPVGRMTTNILLEWGEADLEDFLAERQPPVFGSEVRIFWKELFGVAEALRRVHNFTKKNGQEFDGWHADIKPDNILRVQSRFKLSDPGFAKFMPKKPNNTTRISGGTSTYGAPEWERSRKTKDPVPQSIDIWSLGCVFSIVCTWVALGYKGVLVYERLRIIAAKASLDAEQSLSSPNLQGDERPEADFFHNGSDVLDIVQHWHDTVRQYLRKTDKVTPQVLDLVTKSMLRGDPKARINAADLCTKLGSILETCPEKDEFALPEVQEALDEVQTQNERLQSRDFPQPSSQKEAPIQGRAAREARKSYNVHMARMRSEYIGSHTVVPSLWPSTSFDHSKSRTSHNAAFAKATTQNSRSLATPHSMTQPGAPLHDKGRSLTEQSTSANTLRTSTREYHKPQDVFQARCELEELAAEKKRGISGRIKGIVAPNRAKDPFLAEFFRRRDIIFVADNAGSMTDAWPQATELLDVLAKKVRNLDENGMDLYLTHTNGEPNAVLSRQKYGGPIRSRAFPKVENQRDVAKFKEAMKAADSLPVLGARTDMSFLLGFLLDEYIRHIRNTGTVHAKAQTIIVLTDGKWELNPVSKVIKKFVDEWKGLDRDNIGNRPMGIQFIQFGDDPDATLRLEYLDNKLEFEGVPDIVDTEPSLGDVYKMLLGSFVGDYDERSRSAARLPPMIVTSPRPVALSPSFSAPPPPPPPPAPEIMFSEHLTQNSSSSIQESNRAQESTPDAATSSKLPLRSPT